MRKIKLYIASSLDGYIARENGDVDWLEQFQRSGGDYGYQEFYNSIDTTVMGNKTYTQVLGFGDFPYKDKRNLVLTRQNEPRDAEFVEYINHDIIEFIKELKDQDGKDIWLIGGSIAIELLHNSDLIDEYILFIMPVTLGSGIPLFTKNTIPSKFSLMSQISYQNGVIQLIYKKINDSV
ncbi:MAG: dihydrofolate reductase family protein [Promethearchaeota archaeon]|jgi:dihydrofolate reductase